MRVSVTRFAFPSVAIFASAAILHAQPVQRFYPDDPLWKEPPPEQVGKVEDHRLVPFVDFYKNTVHKKGQRNTETRVYPSEGANTLGEVPDSVWFTNRHDIRHRLSAADLVKGPAVIGPPEITTKLTVASVKAEGVTPGFTIKDSRGRRYFLKFDPPSNPEMATAADVICSRFLYAIGYNVPENYILRFSPEQVEIAPGVTLTDAAGRKRKLTKHDVTELLRLVAQGDDGFIRAVASAEIPGEIAGGFKYYKHRPDDPNELAPHEHLRVLRGLYVFAAWLNQTDAKALNTLDTVVEENGRRFLRHYLLDFGSALGSDALYAKDPRLGHEFLIEGKSALRNLATGGLYVPKYARVDFPDNPAVGNFSSEGFEPDRWKPNYPNAAFANRLPGDEYWATKKLIAFTDADIRATVATGSFSDPAAAETITRVLIERRDKIAHVFLQRLLAFENFRIEGGRLVLEDLAASLGIRPAMNYSVQWNTFDNANGALTPVPSGTGAQAPERLRTVPRGSYCAAIIRAVSGRQSVTVYFRREDEWKLVGIQREGADDARESSY